MMSTMAIACISQLTTLLRRETDAFDRMDTTLIVSLHAEKRRLVDQIGQLAGDGTLSQAPTGRDLVADLLSAVEANSRSCDRAMSVQHILIGIVGRAAGRATSTGRYGDRGKPTAPPRPNALAVLSQA